MTIDKRPNTTRTDPGKPSSNQVTGGPRGTIPTPGNSSKEPKYIPSQKPAPGQSY
ncbi:hypothetical protein [Azotobacter chroococcum]|uniref:hypothetical protein n=1 Tax=Azotobacter chroococcum TaxID=353 RepID=UPI00146ACBBF|nr:hypothetical protein [Azotobacter chroococcum]